LFLPLADEWVGPLIEEAAAFPNGRNDDGIDMLAYAINRYLTRSNLARLEALASR
jgi:phage terminase large subunit-like protein